MHYWFLIKTIIIQYNKDQRDWQTVFATMRFCYMEVLFHILYYSWGKENRSLYQGLCYKL